MYKFDSILFFYFYRKVQTSLPECLEKLLKYEWIWIGRIEHNNILKYVLNYVATRVHQAL